MWVESSPNKPYDAQEAIIWNRDAIWDDLLVDEWTTRRSSKVPECIIKEEDEDPENKLPDLDLQWPNVCEMPID